MRFLLRGCRALAAVMAMLIGMTVANAASLSTPYLGGNNHRGNMFDVLPASDIAITQVQLSSLGAGNFPYAIYMREGTWNGHANSPSDWTLLQTGTVVGYGAGNASDVIPLASPVSLAAGVTYGFYVTSTNTGISVAYTDGSGVGNVLASDANLTIFEGGGLEYPFTAGSGGVFQPRSWNGTLHYELVGPTTQFVVSAPTTATSGTAFDVTVTAQDANGYTTPSYSGTVRFTSSAATATLPANSTLTNGTGTFSATLRRAGNQTVTAADVATPAITGTSAAIAVAAVPLPAGATSIPTLSEWGLIIMSSLIAMLGIARVRRHSRAGRSSIPG